MPDVVSRIKLEATGADQAAREVQKLKEAYMDVLASVEQLSEAGVGAAGVDPFSKAMEGGMGPPLKYTSMGAAGPLVPYGWQPPTPTGAQPPVPTGEEEGTTQRRVTGLMAQITQTMRVAGGTTEAARGGDITGTGTGLGGIIRSIFTNPILGIGALLAGGAAIGVKKEFEMIKNLFESGATRRLGQTYGNIRDLQVEMANTGDVSVDELMGLFSGIGVAGGGIVEGGEDTGYGFRTMAERMSRYGVEAGVMGNFLATTQRAGFQGTGERNMQLMANVFGVGRTGQGLSQIATILEDAMARGARQGSQILEEGAGRIAREAAYLGTAGGFSMEAAFRMVQSLDRRVAEGARPQTAVDVMTLRSVMAANPGMTLFEAQEYVNRNPLATREVMMQNLATQTGGNRDLMGRILMGQGFAPAEAGALTDMFIETGGVGGAGVAGSPLIGLLGELGAYGDEVVVDEEMRRIRRLTQRQMFAGAGASAVDALANVIAWLERITGGETPPGFGLVDTSQFDLKTAEGYRAYEEEVRTQARERAESLLESAGGDVYGAQGAVELLEQSGMQRSSYEYQQTQSALNEIADQQRMYTMALTKVENLQGQIDRRINADQEVSESLLRMFTRAVDALEKIEKKMEEGQ